MATARSRRPKVGARKPAPSAAKSKPLRPAGVAVAGIGASAGGLEAFTLLLKHLPVDTGMGFVLVQHLDPNHESALTHLLARATSMPVHEVTNNMKVEGNHVYVIPPNTSLSIAGSVLKLAKRSANHSPHRSIDTFFESLAADQHERAIGVVLSGTATDGTLGLEAIKAEGGITFAQDESAKYDSMPRSAIAAGCVDLVLSPENIARELARIARHPLLTSSDVVAATTRSEGTLHAEAEREADQHGGPQAALASGGRGTPRTDAAKARAEAAKPAQAADDGYRRILLLLRNHCGVDFSLYKSSTIQRRVGRRMVLGRHERLDQYADFLKGNTKELDALYSDVLISVTSFFRNPDAFDALKRKVFPKLLEKRAHDDELRVWTLGCSTGQEAYSIAMSYAEFVHDVPRPPRLQVFATDLNEALLEKARHGLYAKTLEQDVSPERLREFFVEEQGGYRIAKSLREQVVFARQNVVSDPPFSRIDLVSCRNLLIYFESGLQQKIIPAFHYALKPGGFLFLGASESVGGYTHLFEPADKKQKIFSKKAAPTPLFRLPLPSERRATDASGRRRPASLAAGAGQALPESMRGGLHAELSAQREADRIMVNQFAPPGVLVNEELQIVQFRGPTSAYLEPPKGKATFDLLKMAREGLLLPLRALLNKAKRENKPVRKDGVRVHGIGTAVRRVNLQVVPLTNLNERGYLVLFEPADASKAGIVATSSPTRVLNKTAQNRRIAELEGELAETRDYLQSVLEQHEASNEELQASNEEIQSANEEMQSVNEELETSKEELESTNEELVTVNEEMVNRNTDLNWANADLSNLQASLHTAIVLLDRNLAVRRFTPQAEQIFNLLATDLGRSLSGVRHTLQLPDLERLLRIVIDTVSVLEREVQDENGCWYTLRARPYLTLDNRVDGAVLMLVDIDQLKRSELSISAARDYAMAILRTARDPLLVLDRDLRVETANDAFYRLFKVTPQNTEGHLIYKLGNSEWDLPELRKLLEEIIPDSTVFNDYEVEHTFGSIGHRYLLLNARLLKNAAGEPARIVLGIQDITERRRNEELLNRRTEQFENLLNKAPVGIYFVDEDLRIRQVNPIAMPVFGDIPDLIGRDLAEVLHILWEPAEADAIVRLFRHTLATGAPYVIPEMIERRLDRGITECYAWQIERIPLPEGRQGVVCYFRDISAEVLARRELNDADARKNEFLAMLSHELRNPLSPILAAVQLLRMLPPSGNPIEAQAHAILTRQVGQLKLLIDDLLEISRISSGKMQLQQESIAVSSLAERAVETARPMIEGRRHALKVSLPLYPLWLRCDPARLEQVLVNLLSNAAKFTDEGGQIGLTVHQEGEAAVLRVRDSGVGIAPEMLPRIFDLFTQAARTLDRSQGGLGIGLSLVKRVVEMHDGTVEVTSVLNEGSEFVVRLPVGLPATPEPPAVPSKAPPAHMRLRVLVVDDAVDTTTLFSSLLVAAGHEPKVAHNGPDAVTAALEFLPHVMLMDIGLPGFDGFEVAQQIRLRPELRNTVLVAMTGYGQQSDRQRAHDVGFAEYLLKPVDFGRVQQLLALVMEKSS